jgi:two-component system cell cycle sensor histidine kinase PleC
MLKESPRTFHDGPPLSAYAEMVGDYAGPRAASDNSAATAPAFDHISCLSHELRTPLNTMLGFSALLAEHSRHPLSGSEIVQYAKFIHQASSNLLDIINSLIELSRIRNGTLELRLEDVRLADVVLGSIEEKQMAAREAGIRLDYSIASGIPLVHADEKRLRQVLSHFIDNAIQSTDPGGLVHVAALAVPPGATALIVRDTGAGMTSEDVAKAPGVSEQDQRQWTSPGQDVGLGLPIVKGLVGLHGGSIQIASAESQGTEVLVVLPAADTPGAS